MKVCPICNTRYQGPEVFCAHDGGRLVDARELSPGKMTGTTIHEAVTLTKLLWEDPVAERYEGTLVENDALVRVTVFNQQLKTHPDASDKIRDARVNVGTPLPVQLSHPVQSAFELEPPWIAEVVRPQESLRDRMRRQPLDWKEAATLVARIARIADWLFANNLVLHTFVPETILVPEDLSDIQITEWVTESIRVDSTPFQTAAQSDAPCIGYAGRIAPELIHNSQDPDQRTIIWGLGVLFYELLVGKLPLSAPDDRETLHRILHEKPARLRAVKPHADLHPDLEDVIEMFLHREPDKRFQTPAAIVAVLSNLIGAKPDELAPRIVRADSDADELYQTVEMGAVDRAKVEGQSARERTESGSSKIIVSADLLEESEASKEPAPKQSAISGVSETRDDVSPKKTLMFGMAASQLSEEQENAPTKETRPVTKPEKGEDEKDAATVSEKVEMRPSRPVSKTLLMGNVKAIDEKLAQATQGQSEASAAATNPEPVASPEVNADASDKEPVVDSASDTTPARSSREKRRKKRKDSKSASKQKPGRESAETLPLGPRDEQKLKEVVEESEKKGSEAKVEETAQPESKETEKADGFAIGSVEVASTTNEGLDDWFGMSDDQVWEASVLRAHHEKAEQRSKTIMIAIVSAILFIGLSFFVYVQFIWTPEEDRSLTIEVPTQDQATEDAPAPSYDAAQALARFNRAMESGRVIAPPSSSAASIFDEMRRRAPESEEFAQARELFLADTQRRAQVGLANENLTQARNYLGYARQYAPEDEELKEIFDEVERRFRGEADAPEAIEDSEETEEDTTEDEAEVVDETSPQEPPPPTPEPVATKTKTTTKATPRPKADPEPRPAAPTVDSDQLVRDARSAFSRGNVDLAQQLYEMALAADPNNHVIHAGLGQVYFEKASYDRAANFQQGAVRLSPNNLDYRVNLGQSYYRLGQYQRAIDTWQTVLDRDPNNQSAQQYIELARRRLN